MGKEVMFTTETTCSGVTVWTCILYFIHRLLLTRTSSREKGKIWPSCERMKQPPDKRAAHFVQGNHQGVLSAGKYMMCQHCPQGIELQEAEEGNERDQKMQQNPKSLSDRKRQKSLTDAMGCCARRCSEKRTPVLPNNYELIKDGGLFQGNKRSMHYGTITTHTESPASITVYTENTGYVILYMKNNWVCHRGHREPRVDNYVHREHWCRPLIETGVKLNSELDTNRGTPKWITKREARQGSG
ncbi:uncharacterized protein [Tursiops truncatus]|uniref:uncharacterized protein n=1 Tax=Tursiops truncatus TaxID=9739 RepID=UPI003CCF1A81